MQATGATACVMDFSSAETLSQATLCSCCNCAAASFRTPETCFNSDVVPRLKISRVVCRSGLTSLAAPIERKDQVLAHVVLSGFVTSTRERRGLYERMLARGLSEEQARRFIKGLPLVSRRQAEAYLSMLTTSAKTLLGATSDRIAAASRVEELRLFVSAGHQIATADHSDESALSAIAEEAIRLIDAPAGVILCPRGSNLEVTALCGDWRGSVGDLVPMGTTVSGKAFQMRNTVVSSSADGGPFTTLAMPLMLGKRVLGVLEARIESKKLPLDKDRLSRLVRFSSFIAIALDRDKERREVDRAMVGYVYMSELAASLGAQIDTNVVAQIVEETLSRSFAFGVAGLVLTGWGRDRVDVIACDTASKTDIDQLLEAVSGRDAAAQPFAEYNFVSAGADAILADGVCAEDWALAVCDLNCGEITVGWLFVARGDGEHYSQQDHALLRGIAGHAGAAFGRAALFRRVRDDYARTVAALSASIGYHRHVSKGRSSRVTDLAIAIGKELGLDFELLEQLRLAGLFHEVGRSGSPEEIMLGSGTLTTEEIESARRHPEVGASVAEQIELLKALTPVMLHHHEHWDGSGYPEGLRGDKIPLLSRVLAVAEAFESMTSGEGGQGKRSFKEAREKLEAFSGTNYDPECVAALLAAFDRLALAGGTGLFVEAQATHSEFVA